MVTVQKLLAKRGAERSREASAAEAQKKTDVCSVELVSDT
jgi:hypothetical protein